MKKRAKVTKSARNAKSNKKGMLYCTVPCKISYGVLLVFALIGLWLVLLSVKMKNLSSTIPATTVNSVNKVQSTVKPTTKPVKVIK